MRRIAAVFALILAACASPAIRLSPRYAIGADHVYRLTSEATTEFDVAGVRRAETTSLKARSRIQVISVSGGEATLRLTVTPEQLVRDGKRVTGPAEQQVELIAGPDGSIRQITSVGGLTPELAGAADLEDLAPLLGAPLPQGRVRLGARWTRTLSPLALAGVAGRQLQTAPGRQRGRLAALRVVRGYDCAVVALGTERPLVRSRDIEGRALQLSGREFIATETAFAFREGFPVEINTRSEGRFTASSAGLAGGAVTIAGTTQLVLLSPLAR